MASDAIVKKKRRKFYRESFLLEPGQSLEKFNKLRDKWNKILATSGHSDIEFVSKEGITSPFFKDYPTTALAKGYTWDKEQYFRVARLIYWHYPWKAKQHAHKWSVYKFIWGLHADGMELKEITVRLKKRWNQQSAHRRTKHGLSIFWVHQSINLLKQECFQWYNENLDLFLDKEESLSDKIATLRASK